MVRPSHSRQCCVCVCARARKSTVSTGPTVKKPS